VGTAVTATINDAADALTGHVVKVRLPVLYGLLLLQ
jgi:hypothetical protein